MSILETIRKASLSPRTTIRMKEGDSLITLTSAVKLTGVPTAASVASAFDSMEKVTARIRTDTDAGPVSEQHPIPGSKGGDVIRTVAGIERKLSTRKPAERGGVDSALNGHASK